VNPCDMPIDDREAPAGRIMLLGQMLIQHALTEFRLIPRNLLPLGPRFWEALPIDNVIEFHYGDSLLLNKL
jgi:hypothetical protein